MNSQIWQVMGKDQIYEGDLDALVLVTSKGYIKPNNKVRYGEGDWIEAQQVPELYEVFLKLGMTLPAQPSLSETLPAAPPPSVQAEPVPAPPTVKMPPPLAYPASNLDRVCFQHHNLEGRYFCPTCSVWRCKQCVRRYEEVGVCPDCGGLCQKADAVVENLLKAQEKELTFHMELLQAIAFPIRHPISTIVIWIMIWMAAAMGEAASDLVNNPPFEKILIGPIKNIGFLGGALAFCLSEYLAFGYLMRRADGHEDRGISKITTVMEVFEPLFFWGLAVFIGLFPICFHLYLHQLQGLTAVLIDADPSRLEKPTFWYHTGTVCFTIWALYAYPMEKVIAATKKHFDALINPLIIFGSWFSLKEWLIPAFAITAAAYLLTGGLIFILRELPGSVGLATAALTCASLISSQVIGVALYWGWKKLDIRQADPEVFQIE